MRKITLISIVNFVLFMIPFKVFAHSTEETTSESVMNYWSIGFLASLIILIIFIIMLFLNKIALKKLDLKNKKSRKKAQVMLKRNKIYITVSAITSLLTLFFLIMLNLGGDEKVTFTHIHGLGYTSSGEELYVPSHDGLIVFKNGHWTAPEDTNKHDYMGFSMYEDGFYSSGHPSPNSNLKNPLGIIKSTDQGQTIEKLDLYGEIDFHGMTVGYETEDIYVFNPTQNSRMNQPGLYYSSDKTKTWGKSEMTGVSGQATSLAAHPIKKGVMVIGTNQGLFLSEDYGDNFEKLSVTGKVTAVSFGHQNQLLVSTQNEKVNLLQFNLDTNEFKKLNIPNLSNDAITYIQQNPANKKELVFTTNSKNIYISYDDGETWEKSVDKGEVESH
ncbi:hypothetical protein E3U55_14420 [Filobacillus milosensis]|uniref:Glycosyl hydrolase n=1 Tax=Filobacillus milosensis TaxID=94137 RepID=A0A4Y8IG32_9BACI|nr:hypothetical protein [Filobacillus milosensis]TFB14107.1 hypothetical protein E3U55_14420 [Filobacillus milosensis]